MGNRGSLWGEKKCCCGNMEMAEVSAIMSDIWPNPNRLKSPRFNSTCTTLLKVEQAAVKVDAQLHQ